MKIRASKLGTFMTGYSCLTESQAVEIKELRNKPKALTDNQAIRLGYLLEKQKSENDQKLGKTSESVVREIWVENELGRRKEIQSKYLDKGIEIEEQGIDLYCDVEGVLGFKNKDRKENDYFTGECDLLISKRVDDIKVSWDLFTFLEAELTTSNYWQGQAYMDLWEKDKARTVYCLLDTPDHLLLDEFRRLSWKLCCQEEDIPDQLKYEIAKNHIFTDEAFDVARSAYFPNAVVNDFVAIPAEKRVKIFEFERNQKDIELAYKRIESGRNYYKTIKL